MTYECMKCGYQMLTNSFICARCEHSTSTHEKSTKSNNRLVSKQNDRELITKKAFTENESAYWGHAHQTRPHNEEGEIIEDEFSNPDSIAETEHKSRLGSKCCICGQGVMIANDGIDKHVHDTCWNVFKGDMMRVVVQ